MSATAVADLRADSGPLFLSVLLLVVAFDALALWVLMRRSRDPTVLFFGLFVGMYSVRMLASTRFPEFLFGVPRRWLDAVTVGVDDLIFLPAVPFFRRIVGDRWNLLRLLWRVCLVFSAVAIPYEILRGASPAIGIVRETLVLVFLAALVVNLVPGLRRGSNPDLRLFGSGVLIFASGVLHDHAVDHGLLPWGWRVEWPGFLVFVGLLAFIVGRRSVGNERRLQAVSSELDTARRIQESILPRRVPDVAGLAFAARYVPATEVGGDFYDFLELAGGEVGVLVADVSGHGVPAALVSSMIKMALASQIDVARGPAVLLSRLNALFCGRLQRQFVTAAYVFVDARGQALTVGGAGHPAPMLFRRKGGTVEELTAEGPIIGRFPSARFAEAHVPVSPGDRLLIYTDGVTEMPNRSGVAFGEAAVTAIVREHAGDSPDALADRILADVREWSQRETLDDDITLVVVDVVGD